MKKLIALFAVLMLWMGTSAFTFKDAVDHVREVRRFIMTPVHHVIDETLSIADSSTAKAGSVINDTASATKRYVLDITARVL